MKTLLCLLALSIAVPAVASAAGAPANPDEVTAVPVRYDDLDLSRPADAQRMVARLDDAALNACGASQSSLSEIQKNVRASACFTAALNTAVAQVSAPTVTAAYHHRGEALASR